MKKIAILLSFIFLVSPSFALAVITHDTDSTKIVNGFAASPTNTWTHTTASGSTLGVLTCNLWQDAGPTGTIGSATYNSSSVTLATSTRTGNMYSYVGYITSPSSGANTVSVVVSGNIDAFKCAFSTYAGSLTASVVDTTAIAGLTTSPYTSMASSITTGSADELVVASLSKFGTGVLTVGGGQTTILNDVTGSVGAAAGYQNVVSPSTVTPTWTVPSNTNDWSMSVAAFKPSVTPPATATTSFWQFNDF